MDLSLLIANETGDCTIVDPWTNEDSDIVITVYGPYAKEYAAAFKSYNASEDKNPSELLADLTKGWINITNKGKTVVCNRANAIKEYSVKNNVVSPQLERFILNSKNFLPKR
jgi:hypothetical protein